MTVITGTKDTTTCSTVMPLASTKFYTTEQFESNIAYSANADAAGGVGGTPPEDLREWHRPMVQHLQMAQREQ
ncbi:hypothetical protein J7E78_16120 [Paenibacillus polymyxa]|nr:hypothetical protein [Paenibacillus polymyxa]MBT2285067.1 hypothetical protein [Paenibacillus polymyxa]